jgi:AraC-like DNA-binding protein/ligand-binding sensor domain-containing protein
LKLKIQGYLNTIAVFLFLNCFVTNGISGVIAFQKLTSLSNEIYWPVYSVYQDSMGIMWFAGENNITRFDGNRFEHRSLVYKDYKLQITKVVQIGEEKLLIVTNKGLFVYDIRDLQINLIDPIFDGAVNDMILQHRDTVWLGTNQGLVRYSLGNGVSDRFTVSDGLPSDVVHGLFIDRDSTLWISTWEGMAIIPKNSDKIIPIRHAEGRRLYGQLVQANDGNIWAGGESEISIFNNELKIVGTIPSDIRSKSLPPAYIPWQILLSDDEGMIWHAIPDRLTLYNPKSGYQTQVNLHLDFRIEKLTSLFRDRDGSIWLATSLGNIYRYDFDLFSFDQIPAPQLNLNSVHEIEPLLGKYYAIGSGEGLFLVTKDFKTPRLLLKEKINKLCIDSQNRIWTVSEQGLIMFKIDSVTLEKKEEFKHDLPDCIVSDILVKDPDCWISTFDCGVNRINSWNNETTSYMYHPGMENLFLTTNQVASLVLYGNKVWLGTLGGGINTIDINSDEIERFKSGNGNDFEVLETIKQFLLTGDSIWIAMNKGIGYIHDSDFTRIEVLENLEANQIIMDSNGFLWINHSVGLDVYDTRNDRHYNVIANISSNDDIRLFRALYNDIYVLYNASIRKYENTIQKADVVNTILSRFRINEAVRQVKSGLELSHNENNVSLMLSVLSYRFNDQNRYAAYLEGKDTGWIYNSTSEFYYPKLKPGKYILHYKGANFAGIWSPEKSLSFLVKRSPWLSAWSISGYVLGILLVLAIIVLLHRKNRLLAVSLKNMEVDLVNIRQQFQEQIIQNIIGDAVDKRSFHSDDSVMLQKFINSIDMHLTDDDFSVELIARDLAMSRTKLFRIIKIITGLSPLELMNTYRLKLAGEMLRNRSGNISEIAFNVGYKNPAHFSESFRKFHGCSPSEFINNLTCNKSDSN